MKSLNNEAIGMRLKSLRASRNLSQVELTKRLGFGSTSMVSCYESGKRTITITSLLMYSEYFQVSVDWILKGRTDGRAASDQGCQDILDAYNYTSDERLESL